MYITLDPRTGEHRLCEPDDFTAFSVVVPSAADLPLPADAVPRELGRPGSEGTHVFVLRDAVLELADAEHRSRAWHEQFRAMFAYAGKAGWVSPDGRAIRAHCTAAPITSSS